MKMSMYAVLDTKRVFIFHLKPVSDLLTYLERRYKRFHLGLHRTTQPSDMSV